MVRNIPRIQANTDKRKLILLSNSFGGDPQKIFNMLDEEEGQVWDVEDVRSDKGPIVKLDREGLNRLKQTAGRK